MSARMQCSSEYKHKQNTHTHNDLVNCTHLYRLNGSSESITGYGKLEDLSYIGGGIGYPPLQGHGGLEFRGPFVEIMLSHGIADVNFQILSGTLAQ